MSKSKLFLLAMLMTCGLSGNALYADQAACGTAKYVHCAYIENSSQGKLLKIIIPGQPIITGCFNKNFALVIHGAASTNNTSSAQPLPLSKTYTWAFLQCTQASNGSCTQYETKGTDVFTVTNGTAVPMNFPVNLDETAGPNCAAASSGAIEVQK